MWTIITTASDRIGLGHFIRCLTIRETIGHSLCKFYIISDWGQDKFNNYIQGDNVFIVSSADNICFNESTKNKKILIDIDTIPESLLVKTKNAKRKLLLGQSGSVASWADLVVNSAEGNDFVNKKWFCKESHTEYWEGPSYAILRKQFYYSENNFRLNGKLFIMIGGTDAANLTFDVLKQMVKSFPKREAAAVINKNHKDARKIEEWVNKNKHKVTIEFHRNDIENIMKQSFCAIVAPGVTLFECLALGIPTIAIAQNDRQRIDFSQYPLLISKYSQDKLIHAINEVGKNATKWINYSRSLRSGNKLPELIDWMNK
jgi:spore coat polysaccharide biosynthesis predicted glycosyltransferase SpsG